MGFNIKSLSSKGEACRSTNRWCTNRDEEPAENYLHASIKALNLYYDQGAVGIYDEGDQANVAQYNLFICSS